MAQREPPQPNQTKPNQTKNNEKCISVLTLYIAMRAAGAIPLRWNEVPPTMASTLL
jgi:hypothetical protein